MLIANFSVATDAGLFVFIWATLIFRRRPNSLTRFSESALDSALGAPDFD
jgi:hypothetical protein